MAAWHVIADAADECRGRVVGSLFDEPCALGKNGLILAEEGREGDGKTPMGSFSMRRVFYRPDREETPMTKLPVTPLSPSLGWCDDPSSTHYNRLVQLPFSGSYEKLWRDDHLYDLVIVIGHNDAPVVPGLGSAIFIHVAQEDFKPTLGCVALKAEALRHMLRLGEADDQLKIG